MLTGTVQMPVCSKSECRSFFFLEVLGQMERERDLVLNLRMNELDRPCI